MPGFELFSVETTDGQIQSGILVQQNDARLVLRSPGGDIEIPAAKVKSEVNTHRSLMPEGFEALGGENLRDILAFICQNQSRYRVIDLSQTFTADSRRGLYESEAAPGDTIHFRKYGLVTVDGIPFEIANPENTPAGGNLVVLKGGSPRSFAHQYPRKVEIPVGVTTANIHFLGGITGWGAQQADSTGKTAMRVTLCYSGGKTEVHDLRNGVEFADYVKPIDVPGSKLAADIVTDKEIRIFSLPAQPSAVLEKIILESMDNGLAPTTAAITLDLAASPL